jgi:WD40 repeat protein/transcriptional regulator with XRE-family HTH domain
MDSDSPFGTWLKQGRRDRDLTQEALADQAGCSVEMIRKIEGGTARPSRQLAELLAAALQVPAAERGEYVQWARTGRRPAPNGRPPVGTATSPPAPPAEPGGALTNPYKGLRPFQESDAPDFFGRDALTARLLARLAEPARFARFLAVVGPSGSGKSSVVRAGLLPALRHGALAPFQGWPVLDLVPGAYPLEEVEAALLRLAPNPPASLLPQLREDPRGLVRAAKRALPDPQTGLVLVLDQFEELFTLVPDEAVRRHVLDSLYAAATDERSPLLVVATLRADFYDRPLSYRAAGELLRERAEVVLPMSAEELEQAIVRPAARRGVELEPDLLAAIVRDTGEQPGALPLLQYALTELFEQRTDGLMTLRAYRASGGVQGALSRRAESLYAGLTAAEQEEARQLFLRLVTLGEDGEDTRRRVRRAEIAGAARDEAALERVLDLFGSHRLLTFDRDPVAGVPTVEVAHEALLRSWPRLRGWIEGARESLRVHRRLLAAANEWAGAGQDASYLAGGGRLAQFETLAGEGSVALNAGESAYIAASVQEREKQAAADQARQGRELTLQKRAANRLRGFVGALVVFLLVAAGLAAFAFGQQGEAVAQSQKAQNNAATAVANGIVAGAQRATAVANGAVADNARATAQTNFTHADALRVAAQANSVILAGGQSELAGLLSLRSLQLEYSAEGDAALEGADQLDYPVRRFVGHAADQGPVVWVAALSPDGKTLYTQSDSSTRLWDFATGRQLANIDFGGDGAVSWAPDGKHILATHDDGTLLIWDTRAMTYTQSPITHTAALWWAVYSPDGRSILASSSSRTDTTAQVWDAATGRQLQVFHGPGQFAAGLAWSPDGRYVVTGAKDNMAHLWDVRTGLQVRTLQTGMTPGAGPGLGNLAYSPDGKIIAGPSATSDGKPSIRLWDAATGVPLRELRGHTDGLGKMAFLPDGKRLVAASLDGTVRLWDVATGQQLRVLHGPNAPAWSEALTPDGRQAVIGYGDGTVLLWDLGGPAHPPMPAGGRLRTVRFSADDRRVLTGSDAGHVARLFDTASGRQLAPEFPGPQGSTVNSAVFSPDEKSLLTADGQPDNQAHIWDIRTGAVVLTFPIGFIPDYAIYSPDGKIVATTVNPQDGPLSLWDAASGRLLRTIQGPPGGIPTAGIAFAPDGKSIATANSDHTADLWDVATGQERRRFVGHTDGVYWVAFSPDGKWLATASADRTARLWDVATGQELRRFVGHTANLNGVTFSPDGKWLATASADQTARLWDVATGQELRRFVGHTDAVWSVAFSHDGKLLLTGSQDGTARIWHTDYHDTMRYLCGVLTRDFTPEERTQYGITDPRPTCPGS